MRLFLRSRNSLVLAGLLLAAAVAAQPQWRLQEGSLTFLSEAPAERITATSTKPTGILEPPTRTFAVQVAMRSFVGFNSPLQQEHFNESYVESSFYPSATFQGRIIETMDLRQPGVYKVRAKGQFTLHGVQRERIIPCVINVTEEGIRVTTDFGVLLSDHNIRVPRVVQQKVSGLVKVNVDLLFIDPGKS
jgi:hypothetical protein